jgi:penicillin-binding protein 1C
MSGRLRRTLGAVRRRTWVLAGVVGCIAATMYVRLGPIPPALLDVEDLAPSTQVLDRHGEPLYERRTALGTRGEWLPPDQLPVVVVAATLAAEDHRFRSHPGADPMAIGRALWRNAREGRIAEGGSTISQQVVSLAATRHGMPTLDGWFGKLREAVLALRLEHRLSKDEILARYLAFAPYGNQVDGIARASTYYFGVNAASLTPAQAAYLAALPQQPGRFNPRRDVERARPRQQRILRRMFDEGWIDAETLQVALAEHIDILQEATPSIAPHWVRRVLASAECAGRARCRSTLDAGLQRTVLGILRAQSDALEQHHAQQAAVVVFDNRSQEWIAWATIGSDIDAAQAPRQPGSALKPFTYAAAFERGWTPASVLADVPSTFPTAEPGILYSPRNYDGQFRGPLRARLALAGSENVPAVALASAIGVPAVADYLRRSGLSTLDKTASHYGLGLTLGNAEVRLDELVLAYSHFTRTSSELMSARAKFWIADILSDATARRYAFGEGSSLDFPFPVAAKTGTSQAYHDNWTIGFTNDVTVGVWVGNLDRTPLRYSSGVTGAGPIFHDVMLAAVEHVTGALPMFDTASILPVPAQLEDTAICSESGMVAGAACPARVREHLPHDATGAQCTWHHASDRGVVTVYPAEFREWAQPHAAVAPASSAQADQTATNNTLSISSPAAGGTFLIDPTLRREFQTLALRASGAVGRVEWRLNGQLLGTTVTGGALTWPLSPGDHTFVVRDADGRTAQSRIRVK